MRDLRRQGQIRYGLIESIRNGRTVPIVSDEAIFDLVLEDHPPLTQEYATYAGYPMNDPDNLPRVARFYKLIRQKAALEIDSDFTSNDLRTDFFDFVKNFVYNYAEQHGVGADLLAEAEAQYHDKTVTEFAELLGYPRFDRGDQDPLLVLANLPFRVLLTTSPYTFLEAALRRAGKTPLSTMICWRQDLRDPIEPPKDELHELDIQQPLVCHLFGLDSASNSLVLTEDDYLDFLVNVNLYKDDDKRDSVPAQVRKALSSDLLVLGFSLNSWAFRSLYAGLIKSDYARTERRGICVQLPPNEVEQSYFHDYLQREAHFEVIWATLNRYAEELRTI